MTGVVPTAQRVSFSDLERWPDDGRRYELYDGEVSVVPSPLPVHQVASARLYLALEAYVRVHGGIVLYAPLDIVLTEFDVVQPDLLLFVAERAHLIDLRQVTRHAPDLAIEILSPSTASTDRGRKMALLARHQVREYWLVDPLVPRIEVYALAEDRFVLSSDTRGGDPFRSALLPEFALRPADLIPEAAPNA